jgi:hypothetical protein
MVKSALPQPIEMLGVKIHNKKHRATPTNAVYCGRPGVLGNPFEVGKDGVRGECCDKHAEWLDTGHNFGCAAATEKLRQQVLSLIPTLKGKDLECWCAPERCHCIKLAQMANGERQSQS